MPQGSHEQCCEWMYEGHESHDLHMKVTLHLCYGCANQFEGTLQDTVGSHLSEHAGTKECSDNQGVKQYKQNTF